MTYENNSGYFDNTTFFNSQFALLSENVIWLKPFTKLAQLPQGNYEDVPRNALRLTLQKNNLILDLINSVWPGISPRWMRHTKSNKPASLLIIYKHCINLLYFPVILMLYLKHKW